jgi:hypothetical protein
MSTRPKDLSINTLRHNEGFVEYVSLHWTPEEIAKHVEQLTAELIDIEAMFLDKRPYREHDWLHEMEHNRRGTIADRISRLTGRSVDTILDAALLEAPLRLYAQRELPWDHYLPEYRKSVQGKIDYDALAKRYR